MNNDVNDAALPKDFKVDGQKVLKVLSTVIGDTDKDSGYKVVLENGDQVFVKASAVKKAEAK